MWKFPFNLFTQHGELPLIFSENIAYFNTIIFTFALDDQLVIHEIHPKTHELWNIIFIFSPLDSQKQLRVVNFHYNIHKVSQYQYEA